MGRMDGFKGILPTETSNKDRTMDTNISKMTLGQKQRKFTHMIAKLINFAYDSGYELTFLLDLHSIITL